MTGNGNHTTYINGDDWGMVQMALFYPHKTWVLRVATTEPYGAHFRKRAGDDGTGSGRVPMGKQKLWNQETSDFTSAAGDTSIFSCF